MFPRFLVSCQPHQPPVPLLCRQEQPPHTLPVRRGWLQELTDTSQVQTGQSYLHGFYFLTPFHLPSTSPHREPLGSLDLEFSTPSQIFLICKSVCCCIHSFPMQRHTQESLICAETSDVGSGHLQRSLYSNTGTSAPVLSVFQVLSDVLLPFHHSGSIPAYWPYMYSFIIMSTLYSFLRQVLWVHSSFSDTIPAASI